MDDPFGKDKLRDDCNREAGKQDDRSHESRIKFRGWYIAYGAGLIVIILQGNGLISHLPPDAYATPLVLAWLALILVLTEAWCDGMLSHLKMRQLEAIVKETELDPRHYKLRNVIRLTGFIASMTVSPLLIIASVILGSAVLKAAPTDSQILESTLPTEPNDEQ